MTPCLPSGTEHTNSFGILTSEVLHSQRVLGTNASLLQIAILDDGEGRAVARVEQHHQSAVEARFACVLLLNQTVARAFVVDHVRLQAYHLGLEGVAGRLNCTSAVILLG